MSSLTYEQVKAASLIEKKKSKLDNPNRRAIIDRRTANSDRRVNGLNVDYNGPYRRETIDRRQSNKDRRNK